jgi:membrane-bound ClpP family serine protease
VFGSLFLLNNGPVDVGIDWRLIVGLAIAIAAGFFFVVRRAARARSQVSFSGGGSMVGAVGEARGPLAPNGPVFVGGALWTAVSAEGPIEAGQSVRVVEQNGKTLTVAPSSAQRARSSDAARM